MFHGKSLCLEQTGDDGMKRKILVSLFLNYLISKLNDHSRPCYTFRYMRHTIIQRLVLEARDNLPFSPLRVSSSATRHRETALLRDTRIVYTTLRTRPVLEG